MNPFQRVALINVRIESRQRIPIGLLTLAACIKDTAKTVIFDPDLDKNDLADVVAFKPDLIGIGFMTQTRFRAKQIFAGLRDLDSQKFSGGCQPLKAGIPL